VKSVGQKISKLALDTFVSLAVVIVLWIFALWAFNVQTFIGKNPFDVYAFLFEVPAASENRELVAIALGQTMIDASIGFVVGMFLATLVSLIFTLSKGIEQALMPIAMLLRSVPLVAMAPIIILIFGREQLSVAVMGAIVVLFPALVNIVFGLRSAPAAMFDLVSVYGGSKIDALRTVAFPSSLPSFFAALKISVPGAITGALLVEWLATGQGIGYAIVSAIGRARPSEVWTYVALITVVSIVIYNIVAMLEESVLAKYGHSTGNQAGK
jgi:ABC-type nitrate/sulfonate/bicarbonate transport system permease component